MARNKGWGKKTSRSKEIVGVKNAKAACRLGLCWYCPKKRASKLADAQALTAEQWQDIRARSSNEAIVLARGGYALRKSSNHLRRARAQKRNAMDAGRPRIPRSLRRKPSPVHVGMNVKTKLRTLDVLEACTIVGRIARAAREKGLNAATISDAPLKNASPYEQTYHIVADLNSTEGTVTFLTLVHASTPSSVIDGVSGTRPVANDANVWLC